MSLNLDSLSSEPYSKLEMVFTMATSTNGKRIVRRLGRNLKPIALAIQAFKEANKGQRPNCQQVVDSLNNGDSEAKNKFVNGADLGGWLAGGVSRMDDAENKKHDTNLHKAAIKVLTALKANSPAADFVTATTGSTDDKYAEMAEMDL